MHVIMGDIPLFPHVNTAHTIFSIKLLYNLTTLCLNGPCSEYVDVIIGDVPAGVKKECSHHKHHMMSMM